MADTFTANLKLHLPQLGKKPWKSDWDFNFRTLDIILGGLTIDGSVHAKFADSIPGSALLPFIQSTPVRDLTGAGTIPAGETHEVRIDHSSDITFDLPMEPIFLPPNNDVNCILVGDRIGLNDVEYGSVFVVRVENHSTSDVLETDITWIRKGLKVS